MNRVPVHSTPFTESLITTTLAWLEWHSRLAAWNMDMHEAWQRDARRMWGLPERHPSAPPAPPAPPVPPVLRVVPMF